MDPLTQTIQLLRPQALTWKEAACAGDWALRFPSIAGVAFSLIATGGCRLQLAGREPIQLGEGDFILLTAPPVWTLSDGEPVEPIDGRIGHLGLTRLRASIGQEGGAISTRLLGGHFSFERANSGLLASLLPPIVHIRSADAGSGRLKGVLDLIGDESFSDRPGRGLVIERLLEVVLVEAIRQGRDGTGGTRLGLLAGLADPQIAAALQAMHGNVRHAWTVAQLAVAAGMSRSVFAGRFNLIVGTPPIDYLLNWRMALAKDALRRGGDRLSEVAFDCGYQSASAFSTAFRRTVGCSPARYAVQWRSADRSHALPAD